MHLLKSTFLRTCVSLGLLLFLCLPLSLQAQSRLGRGVYYDGAWWSFLRGGAIGAIQSGRNVYTYSGVVSWNPWLAVTQWFAFRGNFGASFFRSNQAQRFFVSEYEVFLSFPEVGPIGLEFGGGAQTWWGAGGTHPMASGMVLFPVDDDNLNWFRYLYLGYSACFLPGVYTHLVRVGIEVTFW